MQAFGEKARKPRFRFWHRIRARDADRLEAERLRALGQRRLELFGFAQKSKSA